MVHTLSRSGRSGGFMAVEWLNS